MSDRGLTLAVTSSTGVIAAAIGRVDPGADDGLLGVTDVIETRIATDRRHAEELAPRLMELLDRSGHGLADVDRLVVDVGPGRFTGLRVGLATVRALSFALDLPVVGLTSLEILAASVTGEIGGSAPVTAVIDARRQEVFQQTFLAGRPGTEPAVGRPEDLARAIEGVVVGDGADRYPEHYGMADHRLGRHPTAAAMLALSRGRPGRPGVEVGPRYLREPDAVPNIKTRRPAIEVRS